MSSFLTSAKFTFYPSPGDAQIGEALEPLTSLWVITARPVPLVEAVDCTFADEGFLYRIFIFQTLNRFTACSVKVMIGC